MGCVQWKARCDPKRTVEPWRSGLSRFELRQAGRKEHRVSYERLPINGELLNCPLNLRDDPEFLVSNWRIGRYSLGAGNKII